jgi:hypothetical protein
LERRQQQWRRLKDRRAVKVSGFPIAFEESASFDHFSETSPYSVTEIQDYLFWNHYHWVLREEPTTFDVSGPCSRKEDRDRRYWLFEARNKANREHWFVVVGTGKSPFDPAERVRRWMYATTNDNNLSPDEFLDEEYRQQIAHDRRALR